MHEILFPTVIQFNFIFPPSLPPQLPTTGFRSVQIPLGQIKVDMNCPCDVLRTYMYKNFRSKLNVECGESFLFILPDTNSDQTQTQTLKNVEVKLLPREDEVQTFTKQVSPFQSDSRTLISSFTVTLFKDPENKKILIENDDEDDDDENSKNEKNDKNKSENGLESKGPGSAHSEDFDGGGSELVGRTARSQKEGEKEGVNSGRRDNNNNNNNRDRDGMSELDGTRLGDFYDDPTH